MTLKSDQESYESQIELKKEKFEYLKKEIDRLNKEITQQKISIATLESDKITLLILYTSVSDMVQQVPFSVLPSFESSLKNQLINLAETQLRTLEAELNFLLDTNINLGGEA